MDGHRSSLAGGGRRPPASPPAASMVQIPAGYHRVEKSLEPAFPSEPPEDGVAFLHDLETDVSGEFLPVLFCQAFAAQ